VNLVASLKVGLALKLGQYSSRALTRKWIVNGSVSNSNSNRKTDYRRTLLRLSLQYVY
jgi:hypothetical protein